MKRSEAKRVIASLVRLRNSITDEQALTVVPLYPEWREDVLYETGSRIKYKNVLYKVLQSHTSHVDWTPEVSSSLFAKVLIVDENVVSEWVQPDSTNPYMAGDKVSHNGHTWVSLVDNNVWEPSESLPTLWEITE